MNESRTLAFRGRREPAQIPTTGQVIARIALIIAAAEVVVMLVLQLFPYRVGFGAAAIMDVALLLVLSIYPVYRWVIDPFVHARDEAMDHVAFLAYHDALTQLPNRRLLLEHLELGLAACARHGIYGALLLIDLDDFKSINDTHGHDAGDAVLVEVARRLRHTTRKEDLVGRLAGDEFVLLIQQLDHDRDEASRKTQAIAENLRDALRRPVTFGGSDLPLGCSIGIRLLTPSRLGVEIALRDADIAMYRAKQAGGTRLSLFDERCAGTRHVAEVVAEAATLETLA